MAGEVRIGGGKEKSLRKIELLEKNPSTLIQFNKRLRSHMKRTRSICPEQQKKIPSRDSSVNGAGKLSGGKKN